jgi:hypothetical protein
MIQNTISDQQNMIFQNNGQQFPKAVRNEIGLKYFLAEKGYTEGLTDFFIDDLEKSPLRYFIVDDSGSMTINDGQIFDAEKKKIIKCSRWNELLETLKFQIGVSNSGMIKSKFIFLNGGFLDVGDKFISDKHFFDRYFKIAEGSTPLCGAISIIINEIAQFSEYYRQNGKTISIVVMTDGDASDGDIRGQFELLKCYPVHLTLRLFTNEEKIVNYWNEIDRDLELRFDVIDNYLDEYKEVSKANPWLTYGLELHRLREYGLMSNEMDNIDEEIFEIDSIRTIIIIIYGEKYLTESIYFDINDTKWDPNEIIKYLNKTKNNLTTINPFTRKREFWIKRNKLNKLNNNQCKIL